MEFHNYEKKKRVSYSHCGFNDKLMLSDILREAQDISIEHCDSLGIDSAFYERIHRVFLLAKIDVQIKRYPGSGEVMRILTQPYEPTGPQYQRFTRIYDESGELVVECDSRWVFVDTQTRKISRDPEDKKLFQFDKGPKPVSLKPQPIENLKETASIPVQYSMVDRNHHLNNAAYADIICNHLEKELFAGKEILSFQIFYHHEALPQSKVSLYRAQENNRYYFEGKLEDGTLCFEANLELNEKSRT